MKIILNDEIVEKIKNNTLTASETIKYILENCGYKLHFKIKDIKGNLTKENAYNSLSIDKLYNDEDENVKRAYIKNKNMQFYILLEF